MSESPLVLGRDHVYAPERRVGDPLGLELGEGVARRDEVGHVPRGVQDDGRLVAGEEGSCEGGQGLGRSWAECAEAAICSMGGRRWGRWLTELRGGDDERGGAGG